MTKGIVYKINHNKGMIAIQTDGGFSIIETDTGEFELEDQISWTEYYPLGDATITNATQGYKLEVYFQNHDVSKGNLSRFV